MKLKRRIFAALAIASTLFLSACGSNQINNSLTQNINYSVGGIEGVEKSSIIIKYNNYITGPSVDVSGQIDYEPNYKSSYEDIYKKNLKTISVLIRDIGGIDSGKVEVVGRLGENELIPGIVKGSDAKSVSMKDLLSE